MNEQSTEQAKCPKVFISYSWSSPGHQNQIREWADRLVTEGGVEIILDQYDLKEGQDKYAFMERMVTDPSVSNALVFSDKTYAEKADGRRGGVGTESQIISKEVYDKVEQSKFIPIVCEKLDNEEPCLPTFLKARIWIDFSTPEAVNTNWERLVRVLHGKPLYEKPQLGKPPAYILSNERTPISPATGKYASLRQAILQGRPTIKLYRTDFLDSCLGHADSLRTRQAAQGSSNGEKTLADYAALIPVRNHLIDWVLLESGTASSPEFSESLSGVLERLLELKSRPPEITQWSDEWFEGHSIFVYETFLYIVAALLKTGSYDDLHTVFSSYYLVPDTASNGVDRFVLFDRFYGHGGSLKKVLIAPNGQTYISPGAELLRRNATRDDLPFKSVIEAELLTFLEAALNQGTRWYPQTFIYAGYPPAFPFFVRATQHKGFLKLAKITGTPDANTLRERVKAGAERLGVERWHDFYIHLNITPWQGLNLDKLDTLP